MVIKEVWCATVGEELSCMRSGELSRSVVRLGVLSHVPSLGVSRLDALD